LPSKDIGVDLLVTDKEHTKAVSLQVKFSKDFGNLGLKANCWWTLKRNKLAESPADLWVMVFYTFNEKTNCHIIIPPKVLRGILENLHGKPKIFQTYMCVTEKGRCWENRGLNKEDIRSIAEGEYENPSRDLTDYLDNWEPLLGALGLSDTTG
jgi:hypothetical protein